MSSGGQQAGFMELNPVQMGQNWGMHHTGEPQCSLFSVEPQNVSPGQAGLNGLDTGGRNAHHPGTVLAAEDMMSSEMEEWCGLAQQQQHLHQQQYQPQLQQQQQQLHQHQHQHDQFLDSNMSYSSPVSSLLSPGGSSVGARAGSGGMNSRLLSMRQQMNAPPLNVVVPPMSGFSNTNLNIMSPGLLSGEMLNAAGSSAVNRMMTEGSIVRELFSSRQGQGHQLSTTPPPPLPQTSSYPMFNSPAAASAAIDRVLSRASSWVTPSSMGMDSRDPLQSVVPGVRLATSHCLAQFSSDPGFAERAARFSSFSNGSNNNRSPGSEAAARPQSRSSRGGAAAPMKTTAASPGVEGSKLWRTSSCPPLGNDAPSASAGAAGGADDFKHPASNCDAATNSSGSNAPACVDADQRSPSASTGVTESQYQRQQQQQAAAAASEKRKNGGAASPSARNGSGTGGKRLARTSSCPSAVAKLALEAAAVPKIEPGLEQQGNAPEDSSSSEQGDREEGSSDSQGKKRKTGGHDENATSKIPETSPASTTKSSKSGDNEESMVENPKRSRGGDKDPKTDRSCSDSGDSTSPRSVKEPAKPPEVPKPDYIHVRARRGQATDSHSLAERVRREKISERMKFLQDLVPGCSKVTGKAVMLDEIINYVQSLQRQVEFLSVKLASVNPRMDFNMDPIMTKEMLHHQSRGLPHQQQMIMGPDTMTMTSPFAGHLIHHQQQQQHHHHQLLLPMQMAIGSCGMQMQQMTGACGMQQQQQMVPHMGGLSASMMEGLSAPMSPSCVDATSYGDTVSHVNAAQQHSYAAASLGQQGHQWNANWLCSEVDGVDPFAVCVP